MPSAQEFANGFFQRHPKLKRYAPPKIRDKETGGGGTHGEARQHGQEIWLFPKFWDLTSDVQDFVMAHEIGHYALSEYGLLRFSQDAEKAGVDVWDNLPFGQFNKDEAFADAFATYFLAPSELRTRYQEWVPLVEGVTRTAASMTGKPATPSQISYLKHLLKQVGADEPDWDNLSVVDAGGLIADLKDKRGRPVWYGNGQFSHWEKKAMNSQTVVARYFGASRDFARRLATDDMRIISNAGYKDLTGIRRIPIASVTDPKTKERRVIIGNDEIDKAGVRIRGKPYMSDEMMEKLFSGEVVIEEKVDGHPTIIIFGGYTFFCESLQFRHTVSYNGVPFSQNGWPDYTVVYDVIDGEKEPPYKPGGNENWLSRSEKEAVCQMVGAPLVPLAFKGRVDPEQIPSIAKRISGFATESEAEGIVIKNLTAGVFDKFINLEFTKAITDEALWGGVHPMQRREKHRREVFEG